MSANASLDIGTTRMSSSTARIPRYWRRPSSAHSPQRASGQAQPVRAANARSRKWASKPIATTMNTTMKISATTSCCAASWSDCGPSGVRLHANPASEPAATPEAARVPPTSPSMGGWDDVRALSPYDLMPSPLPLSPPPLNQLQQQQQQQQRQRATPSLSRSWAEVALQALVHQAVRERV